MQPKISYHNGLHTPFWAASITIEGHTFFATGATKAAAITALWTEVKNANN